MNRFLIALALIFMAASACNTSDSQAETQPEMPAVQPVISNEPVVLPAIEHIDFATVKQQLEEKGLMIEGVHEIVNDAVGKVLKAEYEHKRVRKGDTIPPGGGLHFWIGKAPE